MSIPGCHKKWLWSSRPFGVQHRVWSVIWTVFNFIYLCVFFLVFVGVYPWLCPSAWQYAQFRRWFVCNAQIVAWSLLSHLPFPVAGGRKCGLTHKENKQSLFRHVQTHTTTYLRTGLYTKAKHSDKSWEDLGQFAQTKKIHRTCLTNFSKYHPHDQCGFVQSISKYVYNNDKN